MEKLKLWRSGRRDMQERAPREISLPPAAVREELWELFLRRIG